MKFFLSLTIGLMTGFVTCIVHGEKKHADLILQRAIELDKETSNLPDQAHQITAIQNRNNAEHVVALLKLVRSMVVTQGFVAIYIVLFAL